MVMVMVGYSPREGPERSPHRGIGEPFPAGNVTCELGRERGKGDEMTWESDEKQSGTTLRGLPWTYGRIYIGP
jgi:hypothetical protein